jgi:hypothetical protein
MTNISASSEKMTNKKALDFVLTNFADTLPVDVAEKLENMVVQLEKRSTSERKPSARQVENEKLKALMLEAIDSDPARLFAVGEMVKEFEFFPSDITPQRVSALCTQLVDADKLIRHVEKRKVFFQSKGV